MHLASRSYKIHILSSTLLFVSFDVPSLDPLYPPLRTCQFLDSSVVNLASLDQCSILRYKPFINPYGTRAPNQILHCKFHSSMTGRSSLLRNIYNAMFVFAFARSNNAEDVRNLKRLDKLMDWLKCHFVCLSLHFAVSRLWFRCII